MTQDTTDVYVIEYLTMDGDTDFAVVKNFREFEQSIIANDALEFRCVLDSGALSEYQYQEQIEIDTTNSCNTETIEILGLSVLYFTVIALGIILLKKFLKK